jgi:hypothetical protein
VGTVVDVLYIGIWSFFVVEALAMLRLAPNNWASARQNVLDITIIVVTAPFEFLPPGFEVLQCLWVLRILDLLPTIHRHLFGRQLAVGKRVEHGRPHDRTDQTQDEQRLPARLDGGGVDHRQGVELVVWRGPSAREPLEGARSPEALRRCPRTAFRSRPAVA